jgi:hypothetical protein
MPPVLILQSKTWTVSMLPQLQAISSVAFFFCFWCVCTVHIYISTYVNVQEKFMFLHFCAPTPPAAAS